MIQKRDCLSSRRVLRPAFDSQRALPGCRTNVLRIEALANPLHASEALQTARRENDRLRLPFPELPQTRIHVTAKLHVLKVFTQRTKLRLPSRAAAPDPDSRRQIEKTGGIPHDVFWREDKAQSREGASKSKRRPRPIKHGA